MADEVVFVPAARAAQELRSSAIGYDVGIKRPSVLVGGAESGIDVKCARGAADNAGLIVRYRRPAVGQIFSARDKVEGVADRVTETKHVDAALAIDERPSVVRLYGANKAVEVVTHGGSRAADLVEQHEQVRVVGEAGRLAGQGKVAEIELRLAAQNRKTEQGDGRGVLHFMHLKTTLVPKPG